VKGKLSIRRTCALLEVPRSSYYAHRKARPPRPVEPVLERAVRTLHAKSRHTIGSRRLSAGLRAQGFPVGRCKAGNLLRRLALPKRRRRYEHYKRLTKPSVVAPNLLNREFDPAEPNRCWVGDITQMKVGRHWLYVAVVMDLFSRRVIGWSWARYADARLPEEALAMALEARRPPAGVIFHSDQGCQYTSDRFVAFLARCGVRQSMSRRGNCWDNAVIERLFKTLKYEWVPEGGYSAIDHAQKELTDFLVYYNLERPHSRLNDVPPVLFEQLAAQAPTQVSRKA
jgi:putative transposase